MRSLACTLQRPTSMRKRHCSDRPTCVLTLYLKSQQTANQHNPTRRAIAEAVAAKLAIGPLFGLQHPIGYNEIRGQISTSELAAG